MGEVGPARMGILVLIPIVVALSAGCSDENTSQPRVTNHPPVIRDIRDTTAVVGDTLYIQVEAFDEDGDDVRFNLLILCSWADFQQGHCPLARIRSHDLVFWFWPRTYDVSLREFIIEAHDGRGGSDSTGFCVTVVPGDG